ncbi:unnamed protein product, partial [Mesorhabditis belari]|uniref:Very-long-chain (3R)-3-hydroxyacyl-CoA dehydratase n=1 Tax=Mesorhabditis belari TaxID=2138241 RepID=A0AAF3E9Y7_9BILA
MGKLTSFYLCAFNIVQFSIHLFLFYYVFATHFQGSYQWNDFGWLLKLGTITQLMDIPHSFLGITRTSTQACLIQVLGRLTIIYLVEGNPYLHEANSTLVLLFAYMGVELFRYPFYAFKALNHEVFALTWLRYSVWMFFYPLGLTMEAVTMIRSIPWYYASGRYSLAMPNVFNFGFNMGVFLTLFVSTCFLPVSLFLLGHMNAQRKKKLSVTQKIE